MYTKQSEHLLIRPWHQCISNIGKVMVLPDSPRSLSIKRIWYISKLKNCHSCISWPYKGQIKVKRWGISQWLYPQVKYWGTHAPHPPQMTLLNITVSSRWLRTLYARYSIKFVCVIFVLDCNNRYLISNRTYVLAAIIGFYWKFLKIDQICVACFYRTILRIVFAIFAISI